MEKVEHIREEDLYLSITHRGPEDAQLMLAVLDIDQPSKCVIYKIQSKDASLIFVFFGLLQEFLVGLAMNDGNALSLNIFESGLHI